MSTKTPSADRESDRARQFPDIPDSIVFRHWTSATKSHPIVASYYMLMYADLMEFVPQKIKEEYADKYDLRKLADDDDTSKPAKGCSISGCPKPKDESGFAAYFDCISRCIP